MKEALPDVAGATVLWDDGSANQSRATHKRQKVFAIASCEALTMASRRMAFLLAESREMNESDWFCLIVYLHRPKE